MPLPRAQGLYDPRYEHDACGLGFVAELNHQPSHDIVEKGLEILRRLAHRGAAGCDPCSGDGSGILIQIPHAFYERAMWVRGSELPNAGDYGVAQAFLSRDPTRRTVQIGRNEFEPADQQELYYPPIMRAIAATGFKGFVAQEFIPKRDALTSLRAAVKLCTV